MTLVDNNTHLKYIHENVFRKEKVKKIMSSFERSVKRFSYHIDEIVYELEYLNSENFNDNAIKILSLVGAHQKNKNLIKETYKYLREKCDYNKELYDLYQTLYADKEKEIMDSVSCLDKNTLKFLEIFDIVYSAEVIIKTVYEKDLIAKFDCAIKSKNICIFFDFCFDHNLCEICLFLYIYCNIGFDYNRLLHNDELNRTKSIDDGVGLKVEYNKSASSVCNPIIFVSPEFKKFTTIMFYLKKYSSMKNIKRFEFNIKYMPNIEHIFHKPSIDHDYIRKNLKKIF